MKIVLEKQKLSEENVNLHVEVLNLQTKTKNLNKQHNIEMTTMRLKI